MSKELDSFPNSSKLGIVVASKERQYNQLHVGVARILEHVKDRAAVISRIIGQWRGAEIAANLDFMRMYRFPDLFDHHDPFVLGPHGVDDSGDLATT